MFKKGIYLIIMLILIGSVFGATRVEDTGVTTPKLNGINYVTPNGALDIQTNLNALKLTGGKVIIPCGIYNITSPIIMSNNTMLQGSGECTILKASDSLNNATILAWDTDGTHRNITIKDLTIIGSGQGASDRGIRFGHIKYFLIDNVLVYDTNTSGIYVGSSDYGNIINCRVINNVPSITSSQIYLDDCDWCTVTNNYVYGGDIGIQSRRMNYGVIANNKIGYNTESGLALTEDSWHNTISGNIIRDSETYGIYAPNVWQNTFSNNIIEDSGFYGIRIRNNQGNKSEEGNLITGNTISNSGRTGIAISGHSMNVVSNNYIKNSKLIGSGNYGGITIEDDGAYNSENNIVSGNVIYENTTVAGIIESGSSNNNTFIGNEIRGPSKGVTIVGSNSVVLANRNTVDIFRETINATNAYFKGNLTASRIETDYLIPDKLRMSYDENVSNLLEGGTILNEFRYTNITSAPNNTDIFSIRGDTYSTDYNAPSWWGYRNLVSRVNTYSRNDIGNIYSVWHDYGASQGGNTWMYIYEHPCNTTYTNCSVYNATVNKTTKYGLAIKFSLLQNGTGKEGIRIVNNDPNGNIVQYGFRFLGNYSVGINAGSHANSNFSEAFIDAGDNVIKSAYLDDIKRIRMETTGVTSTPLFIDLNEVIESGSAGLHILADDSTQNDYASMVWLRDAKPLGIKPLLRLQSSGNQSSVYSYIQGDGVGLLVENEGIRPDIQLTANVTSKLCDSTTEGGIYYDGDTKQHMGCNSTHWNALY